MPEMQFLHGGKTIEFCFYICSLAPMSYWSSNITENEIHSVTLERGVWSDPDRHDRQVPYKIYIPQGVSGKMPIIIWSHGLGGSRDGAGFISRYIASYGYIIVHIQHKGSDSGLWEGKPGHPWDVIRNTHIPRRATLQRLLDVPFALDELQKMDLLQADFSKMGMSGHSFGAMTTQTMAGQRRGMGKRLYDLFEPRFKAAIAYSPVVVYKKGNHAPEDFYGGIRIPTFFMTGTEDSSPVTGASYLDRLEAFYHSGGPEQHLLILEDGDHMVYNGSRGKLGDNPNREMHEKIIKLSSLAFWEAYLKDDQSAKDWLTGTGFQNWLGADGEYKFKA